MNYEQAKNMYKTTRKRKLANNTYLEKNDDNSYAVALHGNQIIKFYSDKTVLSSCGWETLTTKDRLNRFSEFNVWQVKFVWYISNAPNNAHLVEHVEKFFDGITF